MSAIPGVKSGANESSSITYNWGGVDVTDAGKVGPLPKPCKPGKSFRFREETNTESYDYIKDNFFLDALGTPLSTFSIDVDTASYSNVRRFLMNRA
ncbi:MAG: hypothetical protein GY940_25780, partial [bacterium]|nr:hypothetical protein [bacterium]